MQSSLFAHQGATLFTDIGIRHLDHFRGHETAADLMYIKAISDQQHVLLAVEGGGEWLSSTTSSLPLI